MLFLIEKRNMVVKGKFLITVIDDDHLVDN